MENSQENLHQESFFDSQNGWQGKDTGNSEYKLESSWIGTSNYIVENKFLKKNPRGGWDQMTETEIESLPGTIKGYVYKIDRKELNGNLFTVIKSMRYIDNYVINDVLSGMTILKEDGTPSNNPALLKQVFLIPTDEEGIFIDRVEKLNGVIMKQKNSLESIYKNLQQLNNNSRIIKENVAKTEKIVNQVSNNVMINSDEVDQVSEIINNNYREANRLTELINAAVSSYESSPGNINERSQALSYREYAQKINEYINKAHRLQQSFETQIATRLGEVFNDKLPSLDTPEISRKLLFAPIIEYYLARGFNCVLENGEMKIKIKDQVLVLGEKIKIIENNKSIEETGEKTPHRTVREI